jgi:hypothetical protein
MRHESFEAQMHDLLDRRERPEECNELRELAELSPACRDMLAAQQRLFEGLEADEIPELPASFAQRVVTAHLVTARETAPIVRAKQHSTWIWELCVVAALALVAVGGVSQFAPSTEPSPEVAVPPSEPASVAPVAVAQQEPEDLVTAPEDGSDNLAPTLAEAPANNNEAVAAAQPRDAANQRYDEIYQALLKQLPRGEGDEDLLALRPQWVDEMALGFRPVATSFGGAINTLRSTLPPSSKTDRSEKPQAGLLELSTQSSLV